MAIQQAAPEEGRPGDLGLSLGVLLRVLNSALTDITAGCPHGVRGYQVLSTVARENLPSQLALAERLGLDRTVMTYLIDDLAAARLVRRQPNPGDRRQRMIVATPHGARTLARLEGKVREAEEAVLAALSPAERSTFRGLLQRAASRYDDVRAEDVCQLLGESARPAGRP